jgi:hypothetical protein
MLSIVPINAIAEERLYGTWVQHESGQRIDIMDGFIPGKGAVLILDSNGDISIGDWQKKPDEDKINLTQGWDEGFITFSDNSNFVWNEKLYKKQESEATDTTTVVLKNDPKSFVHQLTKFEWLTSLDSKRAIFKVTFSEDSGVIEFSKSNQLEDLAAWGISSGVLKIGSSVIVEARVSDKYFIGLDDSDEFIVFRSLKPTPPLVSTDVKNDRDKFFNEFLTDQWEQKDWSNSSIHRFRPVYGELKGVQFTTIDSNFYGYDIWEYSPSTGALKIGYSEYIGAKVVNNTLALITESGEQSFYQRAPGGDGKRYTTSDVTKISLNENSLNKIQKALSGQFRYGEELYHFEFRKNQRSGYLHKWKSDQFKITGETFSINDSDLGTLYLSEDFAIFDENYAYKRDVSETRLRTKTDQEVSKDVETNKKILERSLKKSVIARVTKSDGTIVDVALPVSHFNEILSLSILIE